MATTDLQHSDYRIRKLIGTLGLGLPLLLPISKWEVLASFSHYYYSTLSSLIFIIVLSSFGLLLVSYRGYKKDKKTEKISDNFLTNLAGFAVLIVVFIPTDCRDSTSTSIDLLCETSQMPLFGHVNEWYHLTHLLAAGTFILCMGWMSRFKFTRGSDVQNHKLYTFCGNMVFASVILIVVFIAIENFLEPSFLFMKYYVFVFETTALVPFGISWLVKGKAIDDVKELKLKMFSKSN